MKDKKPLDWIPLYIDKHLFGSTRRELKPDERSVWTDLLALSGKDEGHVRANEGCPFSIRQLSGLFEVPDELLKRTIKKCVKVGKIKILKDKTMYLPTWVNYRLSPRHKRRFEVMTEEKDTMTENKDTIEEKSIEREEKSIVYIKPEEEVDIHNLLIKVRGLGSIKIKKVIEFLRTLPTDFPDVDYVEAIKKKITWWQDNPSRAPNKSKTNVLSQLRNWIRLQQKWINESKSQDKVGGKKVEKKTKYEMEYLNQIYVLAREKGHNIDKIADVLFGYSEETAKRLQEKFSPEKALGVVLDEIKKGGLK